MTCDHIAHAMLATLAALAMLLLSGLPADAREGAGPACGPREAVIGRLAARFGETRRGLGLAEARTGRGGGVVEIFASDATGSWTVTLTLPDGRTCLIASGRHWEDRMDDLRHIADPRA
jgi:hypothetical protein